MSRPVRQGDLYWIEAEVLRPSVPGVAHPHLVVQDDLFNASRIPTLVVCALTTRLARANEPGALLLEEGEGGLTRPSVVLPSRICVVDEADLGAFIGRLSAERVERVLDGLRFLQRSTRRPGD